MTTSAVVFSGVTFDPSDFSNYGWLTPVTVNGTSYIRILALFAAAMSDLGIGMLTTASSTHNLSTMAVNDAVTITIAQNRPYALGAFVLVAYDASNYFVAQVGATVAGTSITGTVTYVKGSGSHSAWTVSLSGAQGATGSGANTKSGVQTTAFSIDPNTSWIVDITSQSVTGTLHGVWAAQDKFDVTIIGGGNGFTFTLVQGGNKIRGAASDGTVTTSGVLFGAYKNATFGIQTGFAPDNT